MKFLDAARQLTALGFSEQPQLNASPQQRLKHLQQCSPTAVVLMAIMNVDGQAELLLTKRSRQLALHPGEIAFPGGKPESSDADCVATALREADEEVAMPPSAVNYLGQLNKRITRSGFLLTPCVVLVEPVVDLNPNPNEVEAIFTIPLAHLARPGYWQFTLQEIGRAHV